MVGQLASQLEQTRERLSQLDGTINRTSEDVASVLQAFEERLRRVEREVADSAAQVRAIAAASVSDQANHDAASVNQLIDTKIADLGSRMQREIDAVREESESEVLLLQRILVISLSILALPVSCLLVLILYLTLRRDRKVIKEEQRLALNEMNHLRRFNDY